MGLALSVGGDDDRVVLLGTPRCVIGVTSSTTLISPHHTCQRTTRGCSWSGKSDVPLGGQNADGRGAGEKKNNIVGLDYFEEIIFSKQRNDILLSPCNSKEDK